MAQHDLHIFEQIENLVEDNFTEALSMMRANKHILEESVLKLTVQMKPSSLVTYYTEVPAVTSVEFIGSLGGILNLWVGISFITIIEFVELFVNILHRYYHSKNKISGEDRN